MESMSARPAQHPCSCRTTIGRLRAQPADHRIEGGERVDHEDAIGRFGGGSTVGAPADETPAR